MKRAMMMAALAAGLLIVLLSEDAFPRGREYDPKTGRFMQRDPIGYPDGMNAYEYVQSNPVNRTDPTGLFALYYHGKGIAAEMQKRGYASDTILMVNIANYRVDLLSVFLENPIAAKRIQKDLHLTDAAMKTARAKYDTMHFDNVKDAAAVKQRWTELDADMKAHFADKSSVETKLAYLGAILHAAQDFYAHSNFTEVALKSGYTKDNMPTYQDWIVGKTRIPADADLHTGTYPSEKDDRKGHDMMNKDNPYEVATFPGHALHAEALSAADRTVAYILDQFEQLAGKDVVDKAKKYSLADEERQQLRHVMGLTKLEAHAVNMFTGDQKADEQHLWGEK